MGESTIAILQTKIILTFIADTFSLIYTLYKPLDRMYYSKDWDDVII